MAKGRPRIAAAASGLPARGGGGELGAAFSGRLSDRHREAELRAIGHHGLRAAGAALAERDVEADGQMAHAQALVQHLLGEIAIGEIGHLGVEGQDVEQVDAEIGQGLGLLLGVHQPERLGVGLEDPARVRLETDDAQRRLGGLSGAGGRRDHPLVAAMHAVEIAERHGRAAIRRRQILPAGDDTHGLRRPRRSCAGP
jgi:hypothetical protein